MAQFPFRAAGARAAARALAAGLAFCGAACAQSDTPLPTHCRAGEYARINAHMSKVLRPKAGGYTLTPTGKLLSLCMDREKEPFGKVAYRFGPVGKVEMESVATPANKFSIVNRGTTPHTGENVFFFKVDGYAYYVTEATGQGSGIGLAVFKSGKKVLDLFSGNTGGEDYEGSLDGIDFATARSPVFKVAEPPDAF